MRRRSFLALGSAGLAFAQGRGQRRAATLDCGCGFAPQPGRGAGQASLAGFERVQRLFTVEQMVRETASAYQRLGSARGAEAL